MPSQETRESQNLPTIFLMGCPLTHPLFDSIRFCDCSLRSNHATWRDGRVVEGAALEMLFRGNSNEGSNPSLSVQL